MISIPTEPPAASISDRQQLDAVVENIVKLRHDRAELESEQERELTAVRQKYRAPLAELDRYIARETSWVESWAQENRAAFSARQTLACTHATLGFRTLPPRLDRAGGRWTWHEISLKLAELAWGRRYLRQSVPEVNREAIVADRTKLSPPKLRRAGLKIVEEERFFIAPHGPMENTLALELPWLEAA